MSRTQKIALGALLLLVLASLAAVLFTRQWAISPSQLVANRKSANRAQNIVDTRALKTAQQLAPLAVTPEEQTYAREALRLSDLSVDLAFDTALRDAQENPPPLTPEMQLLNARLKEAQSEVSGDEDQIAQLTDKISKARGSAKDNLQAQLDLEQEQLSLDKGELDDAHEDLIRAGGDRRALVQRQLDQHNASGQHANDSGSASAGGGSASPEATQSHDVVSQLRAIFSLRTKSELLQQARQNSQDRISKFIVEHDALEKQLTPKKSEQKSRKHAGTAAQQGPAVQPADGTNESSQLASLKRLSSQQKTLSEYAKRIETEQELASVYDNWKGVVTARERSFLHALFRSAFYIFLIVLLVFLGYASVMKLFAGVSPERRELNTMRAASVVALQVLGVLLILLVIFGPPSNVATVLGLAGAGLTVALKDFIVGFIGWFVLMGKDGIRPGDWVEINGVGGEVVEVGPLHTVLLETGNWLDAAHPTGRKVSFVNSFAIEGHYFNFSTSGQWLWDELQVQVPPEADPYSLADAIQKIVTDETAENARLAEKEWERVTPAYARGQFTAAPSLSVRPAGTGVNILIRYITRANERQAVRGRLYYSVVELLHRKNLSQTAAVQTPAPAPASRP